MDKQVEVSVPSRSGAGGRTSRRRRWVLPLFFLLLVLAIGGGVAWRLTHQTAAVGGGRFGGAVPSVSVAVAGPGTIQNRLEELGTVTPLAGVTVTTQISGILQSVGFTEGQTVKKGDFLAQIDDRPYRALLAQYQGTLAHDQGVLAQAKSDLARYQVLEKQDSIAAQTVTDQQALVAQNVGTVAADQAQIAAQQLNIAYCHITAPVDGVVGLRVVDPGNYVTAASSTGIVVLNQITPISVLFSVPEDNIPALHAAIRSGQPIPVTLYDRADTTKLADGTLSTVDNQIDTATGTLKMRAVFPNTDGELVPNQFVNVDMLVSQLTNVLSVPVNAIQTGAPGSYVYVVDADNVANVTPVTTGAQDSDRVQILSGLNPGDRVVTDGVDRLRDGIRVTIAGPVAAAPVATAVRRHRRRRSGGSGGYGGYGQGGYGGGYGQGEGGQGGAGAGGAAPAGGAPGGAAGSGP